MISVLKLNFLKFDITILPGNDLEIKSLQACKTIF